MHLAADHQVTNMPRRRVLSAGDCAFAAMVALTEAMTPGHQNSVSKLGLTSRPMSRDMPVRLCPRASSQGVAQQHLGSACTEGSPISPGDSSATTIGHRCCARMSGSGRMVVALRWAQCQAPCERSFGDSGDQQMSATLKLVHKAIGAEVRRAAYEVLVDGAKAGRLSMNDTVEIPVAPGRHTLQVRSGRKSSSTETFDAADGEVVAYRCTGKRFLPIFLASFFAPRLALKLVRS